MTLRTLLAAVAVAALPATAFTAEHTLGGGVRYFETVDNLSIDDLGAIEDSGNSLILAYGINPAGILRYEFQLEYIEDGYAPETGEVISPQAFVLLGSTLYGGVGIGIDHLPDNTLGDDTSDAYFIGRLGLDLLLLPRVHLDINANYQTDKFDKVLSGPSSDTLTLGALVHFRFR